MKPHPFLGSLLAFLVSSSPALAADWYVDALNGNDANPGTSPATAWRTISHALSAVPSGAAQTIHVAPGLYDAALGESFQLPLRHQVALVGDQGSASTVIDAGGATVLGVAVASYGASIDSSLRGLTLRNGLFGIRAAIQSGSSACSVQLEDVVIEGAVGAGIYGEIWAFGPVFTGGGLGFTLDRVRIQGCGAGVGLFDYEAHGWTALVARDCVIAGNAGRGVDFLRGSSSQGTLTVERCRITGNAGHGVAIEQSSGASTAATIASSLIAGNGGDGVRGASGSASGGSGAFRSCTIARNAGAGVDLVSASGLVFSLDGCILWRNGDDVGNPFGNVSARYCDIGDGDFAGSDGNFSADPRFRDAAAGDYRLAWASPCVDAGDPAAAPGSPDLDLARRPIDGDLDVVERADVGAFEFGPLASTGPAHVGGAAVFEHWGPAGGRAILHVSRGLPMPTLLVTPFGEFDLDPAAYRSLGTSRVQPGPPALRSIPIPNDPAYLGLTFSFQAQPFRRDPDANLARPTSG